jgi:hypothetical protein
MNVKMDRSVDLGAIKNDSQMITKEIAFKVS